ncbi:phosphotransferase family protein [Poronia punctata]|nr:phosphotransferase family protein [Poronia punctata]
MAPKSRYVSMINDDLAWEENDRETKAWERSVIGNKDISRAIISIILKHRPGEGKLLHTPIRGGYNACYRLEYKDGTSAAMRFPCKGIVRFPEEKVRYEVALMRCIAARTTIPVPKVYYHGTAAENPAGSGPFIIMEYIDHEMTLSEALNDPAIEGNDNHMLDANITEEKLDYAYRQMADILLQLSTVTFDQIGSLVEDEDGDFSVGGRPLTQNMNSLMEFTGMPPTLLPSQPFSSADEWYSALADMHLAQLTFQHNDAVEDEDDARGKYVARQLFRQLASEGKLTSKFESSGPGAFPIFSPDLRPSNILVDKDLRVVSVIDWEFACAAPAQFSFDPPLWLLLRPPEDFPGGWLRWMEAYEPRLETFLRIMGEEEEKKKKELQTSEQINRDLANLSLFEDRPVVALSQRMRDSWENKTWAISLAARNSWEFDSLYWRLLDLKFFGDNEEGDYHARLDLLTSEQREAMEPFVKTKMAESEQRILVNWEHESAVARLAEVMV